MIALITKNPRRYSFVKRSIYLDHHSTTPVDPEVLQEMLPYFSVDFGNPASRHHAYGWKAEAAVELARSRIAEWIGAMEAEVIFTGGATESNNLALQGIVRASQAPGKHIVTTRIEHASVLETAAALSLSSGVEATYVEPDARGVISAQSVSQALKPHTVLVSVHLANNEIGAIQPIREISKITRAHGAFLHVDATQALGRIAVKVDELGIDAMSFSSHKVYGPKGAGALYLRRKAPRVALNPISFGGHQERGYRPGTLNVPAIVGFGKAAELAARRMDEDSARMRMLRDRLWQGIRSFAPDAVLNGPELTGGARLPNNLNAQFPGTNGESVMAAMKGVALSSGSACTEADRKRSHVLMAMGLSDEEILSSLRFGIGRTNTLEEIDAVLEELKKLVGESAEESARTMD